ncbi:MAG: HEAT repeat domain-containing protein [Planctomycetes bacterium]|nr:HEAT repeat domain-containing protein [Planctomycetota bacterium]
MQRTQRQLSFSDLYFRVAADLFRMWPELRRSDIVIVTGLEGEELREALGRGLSPEVPPDIRVVAVRALRYFYEIESVELTVDAMDDPEEVVRAAALETMRVLVGQSEGTPEGIRRWWRGLTQERKYEMMERQWKKWKQGLQP